MVRKMAIKASGPSSNRALLGQLITLPLLYWTLGKIKIIKGSY